MYEERLVNQHAVYHLSGKCWEREKLYELKSDTDYIFQKLSVLTLSLLTFFTIQVDLVFPVISVLVITITIKLKFNLIFYNMQSKLLEYYFVCPSFLVY